MEDVSLVKSVDYSNEDPQDFTMVVYSSDSEKFTFSTTELAEESDYFKALLDSGMTESFKREVRLPCVTSRGLKEVQRFLRECEKKPSSMDKPIVTSEDIKLTDCGDIIQTAVYLQMPNLLEIWEDHLVKKPKKMELFEIKSLADTYQLTEVIRSVDNFMKKNLNEVWNPEKFAQEFDLDAFAEFLESDDIEVLDESRIAEFLAEYLKEYFKSDSTHITQTDIATLKRLLNAVRFPQFLDKLQSEAMDILFKDFWAKLPEDISLDLNAIFKHAKWVCKEKNRYKLSPEDPWNRLRCSKPMIFICGGFTGKETTSRKVQFVSLEELKDSCERLCDLEFVQPLKSQAKRMHLPTLLAEHSVCLLNGFLYAVGGQDKYHSDGRFTSRRCFRFDPLYNSWQQIASMDSPRSLFYLGALNDSIYAVCGWTAPNSVTRTVECYSVQEDTWHQVAKAPMSLHEHAGCVHGNYLFVSGGYKGPQRGHLNQVSRYDPANDEWREMAPLSHSRSYHAMASVGDKIYVAGGVNSMEDDSFEDVMIIEVYDPLLNQWSDLTQSLPRPASCMSSLVMDTRFLLFGGQSFQDGTAHNMLQVFDTETGEFSECIIQSSNIQFFPVAQIYLRIE